VVTVFYLYFPCIYKVEEEDRFYTGFLVAFKGRVKEEEVSYMIRHANTTFGVNKADNG